MMDMVFPAGTKIDETVPESARKMYQRFYIGPLERGFGHTLGNSLRRILLSSIEGAAIIAIRIEGVEHEFSSIEGVRDDVTMIILHLKRVRAKIKGSKDLIRAEIKVDNTKSNSPYIVKASDISGPVEITNPEQYITEVAPGYKFKSELFIARGRGYVPAEKIRDIYELPADVITMDGIFNPIVKVNYEVRKVLYRNRADYDELVLDIWSDGTTTPQEAYEESIDIITDYFESLKRYLERREYEEMKKDIKVSNIAEFLQRSIEELDLPRKTIEVLQSHNLIYVHQIIKKSEKELLSLPNLGRRSIREIKELLNRAKLRLGMTDEEIAKLEEEKKNKE